MCVVIVVWADGWSVQRCDGGGVLLPAAGAVAGLGTAGAFSLGLAVAGPLALAPTGHALLAHPARARPAAVQLQGALIVTG